MDLLVQEIVERIDSIIKPKELIKLPKKHNEKFVVGLGILLKSRTKKFLITIVFSLPSRRLRLPWVLY